MFQILLFSTVLTFAFGFPKTSVPLLDGRIVGGTPVAIESFNYQASLLYQDSHICGCVIIRQNIVLTAAHCTDGASPADLKIRGGSSTVNSGGVVLLVSTIHQHPSFGSSSLDFDFAILITTSSFTLGASIGVIGLPTAFENIPDGLAGTITGWGSSVDGGGFNAQLQAATVNKVGNSVCTGAYGSSITSSMFCAAGPGQDACQGDAGGPMVANGKVLGIVSWGTGCGDPSFPGVYCSVPFVRDYITQTTGM